MRNIFLFLIYVTASVPRDNCLEKSTCTFGGAVTCLGGIQSLVRQLDSPEILKGTYAYDVRRISKFLSFSFKLTEETVKYLLFKVIRTI